MTDFEVCLKALHPDREQASQLYLDLYRKVLTYFESNRCLDSNSCADIVMDRFCQKASKETVLNPRSLIFSIAWHILHEYWQNHKRKAEAAGQLQAKLMGDRDSKTGESDLDLIKSSCRQTCLALIAAEDRTLIRRYNEPDGQEKLYRSRKNLAIELGVTLPDLRKRVFEIRNALRDCYTRCVSTKSDGQK